MRRRLRGNKFWGVVDQSYDRNNIRMRRNFTKEKGLNVQILQYMLIGGMRRWIAYVTLVIFLLILRNPKQLFKWNEFDSNCRHVTALTSQDTVF